MPGPTFGFVKLLASSGSHCTKWADEQHWQAGFESRLLPDLPLPFIPTLIGLRAFDLVSSRVWWEAATNTTAHSLVAANRASPLKCYCLIHNVIYIINVKTKEVNTNDGKVYISASELNCVVFKEESEIRLTGVVLELGPVRERWFRGACIKITTTHLLCQAWFYFYWVFTTKTPRGLTLHQFIVYIYIKQVGKRDDIAITFALQTENTPALYNPSIEVE